MSSMEGLLVISIGIALGGILGYLLTEKLEVGTDKINIVTDKEVWE